MSGVSELIWVEVVLQKRLQGCRERIVRFPFRGSRALARTGFPGTPRMLLCECVVLSHGVHDCRAVDGGKSSAMMSVTGGARRRLLGPVEFAVTQSGLRQRSLPHTQPH
jgi:hypothetical protein